MFNPNFNKRFGQHVVAQRTQKKMTQAQLAKRLGFSAQFLGRAEKGFVGFPEKSLIKAVKLLNINKAIVVAMAETCASEYCTELLDA